MVKKIGKYELGKTLGKGTFSKVKLARVDDSQETFAIKIIDKAQLAKEHMEEQLKREIAIMKHLKHDHIVQLQEVLQTAKHIYIVLELITGGELFDRIVAAKRFDENTGRKYFQQLVCGIYYCHHQGIAHRDLKPENLLLDGQDRLKISDFGLSNLQRQGTGADAGMLLQTVCGTPNYVAPEVLKEKGYNGFTADVWSCGVILFVMLAGYLPFDDPNMNALFNKIERGEYRMARYFSADVKDLISKMLVVDPAHRLTLEKVMEHPWFRVGWDDRSLQEAKQKTTKIAVSSQQCDDAIQNAEPSEAAGTKPGVGSGPVAGGLDAFDIISRLCSGTLNPLVSNTAGLVRRALRVFALGTPEAVQAKCLEELEKIKANPKVKEGVYGMKGFSNSTKGSILAYEIVILPTVTAGLVCIEVRKTRGDTLEFGNFYRWFRQAIGSITSSGPPPPDEGGAAAQ